VKSQLARGLDAAVSIADLRRLAARRLPSRIRLYRRRRRWWGHAARQRSGFRGVAARAARRRRR